MLSAERPFEASDSRSERAQQECRDRVCIIGAGINGLVAANYLARGGFSVTMLERQPAVGGACFQEKITIDGKEYPYQAGASVFGFMQKFVFEETGLNKRVQTYAPEVPHGILMENDPASGLVWSDEQMHAKWGEHGRHDDFENDGAKVVEFLQRGYRAGEAPTLEAARRELGPALVARWIEGTGRELVDAYCTSEQLKQLYLMSVNESGTTSIDAPYSAFSIPLMNSGSVFDGVWGFVRGGIHNIAGQLHLLNQEAGVTVHTGATVNHVDAKSGTVTYEQLGKEAALATDRIIFATEPVSAARLLGDRALQESLHTKKVLGTSGKNVLFFRNSVRWKEQGPDDGMHRFIVHTDTVDAFEAAAQAVKAGPPFKPYVPGYLEIYPEGPANRLMGATTSHDTIAVFGKHFALDKVGAELPEVQKAVEQTVLGHIENAHDFIGSVLLTPENLRQRFGFAGGNIDHVELKQRQTFMARTYSDAPAESFYRFGNNRNVYYCGAGGYPCGSIAGTPGYMCATNIMKEAR